MIMGPSGSGKTTLLTMLGGLLTPSSGKIILDGNEIQNLSGSHLTKIRKDNIGFVFQSFNLLQNLSALENVIIAGFNIKNKKQKAKDILTKLGLGERLNSAPNDLSGGERQRVAIARALINNPRIILADEPTANLDRAVGREVMDILCSIACEDGKTVIVVSHDERVQDIAHRIIYIEDGKLSKEVEGLHNQTCKMPKHYQQS